MICHLDNVSITHSYFEEEVARCLKRRFLSGLWFVWRILCSCIWFPCWSCVRNSGRLSCSASLTTAKRSRPSRQFSAFSTMPSDRFAELHRFRRLGCVVFPSLKMMVMLADHLRPKIFSLNIITIVHVSLEVITILHVSIKKNHNFYLIFMSVPSGTLINDAIITHKRCHNG